MKKVKLFAAILFFAAFAYGQSNKEDVDLIQAMFGKDKKELVKYYMEIPAGQSTPFWTLYDQYEAERKAYGRERISLIEDYAKTLNSLDDATAITLANKKFTLYNNYIKIQKKYFAKMSKLIGAKQAAKLFQLEDYIENEIRVSIQQEIPFIDELEKTLK